MSTDTDYAVKQLEKRIEELESKSGAIQMIDRNSPDENKDGIRDIVYDSISDITWNNYFHYATFFDTLDSTEDSGATVSSNRLFMSANGTSTVDYTRFRRVYQNIFSFDKLSKFRTAFDVGGSSLTTGDDMVDVEAYLGTGSTGTGASDIFTNGLADNNHYGFYVLDDKLYGITSDGSNYTTTVLVDVNVYDLFFVEAVHLPGERVDFYVSEPSNAITNPVVKTPVYNTSISTTLPTGVRTAIYEFSVKNSDGATGDKDLDVGFLEILQKRN